MQFEPLQEIQNNGHKIGEQNCKYMYVERVHYFCEHSQAQSLYKFQLWDLQFWQLFKVLFKTPLALKVLIRYMFR